MARKLMFALSVVIFIGSFPLVYAGAFLSAAIMALASAHLITSFLVFDLQDEIRELRGKKGGSR